MTRQRLDTWKQIADHLGCSERSAKRYQAKGLPVYRLASLDHQRVFAYADELDRWVHQGKPEVRVHPSVEKDAPGLAVSEVAEENPVLSDFHLRLVPSDAQKEDSGFIVDRPSTLVGRDIHADIILPDPRISRRHARILRQDNAFFLEDLKSRNGTALNGSALRSRAMLCHGDRICLGGAVSLLVVLVGASETVDSDPS
jgi:predicted component of type VI protein secretion system